MKYTHFLLTTSVFVLASALIVVAQESVSIHLTLGNPSNATSDESNEDNFLMVKDQYVLSFNNTKGGPNWVSWHLEASNIGKEARGDFHVDDTLPASFKHIKKADYNNAGFDRGHVCNSKDRTDTRENNDATFFMTNILPQAPDNNQGPWRIVEDFERSLAQAGNELYIVAGAVGSGGTGEVKIGKGKTAKKKKVSATSIAGGKVSVPNIFWKVMIVFPKGEGDLSRINNGTRAIAVCMPNKQGIRNTNWRTFVTTIRNVETATGYNFLSQLPSSVQDRIETREDIESKSSGGNPCQ